MSKVMYVAHPKTFEHRCGLQTDDKRAERAVRLETGRRIRLLPRAIRSKAEAALSLVKGTRAMSAIGDTVAPGIVAQDCHRLTLVQPSPVEASDQQPLDLRQGQRRSFF